MPEIELRRNRTVGVRAPRPHPFREWAESTRQLRDRFMAELSGAPASKQAAACYGNMTAIINSLDRMENRLHQIERQDPQAFGALARALATVAEENQ